MESLALRISELEKAIGCVEGTEISPSDVNILSVRQSLSDRGFHHVLKVPLQRLKQLKKINTNPSMRPLSEKLNSIQFCEDLIRQRALLLEDFENRIKDVLESDAISSTPSHNAAIVPLEKEVEEALKLWKQHSEELNSFKEELFAVVYPLHVQVAQLTERVQSAEAKLAPQQ